MRLDFLAALLVRGGEPTVEKLAVDYARRGDPRAALALEAAARTFHDPLRVRALAAKVRGFETERRRAALLGDETLGKLAAELYLLHAVRDRVENVRKMLEANPGEARLVLANFANFDRR
jgi:hypothetical protein